MTIGSVLLGIALLTVVGLFLARPFLRPPVTQRRDFSNREALEAQKEAILTQIRELDFDHETGKVPQEEYESLRPRLLTEAAVVLKELDALQPVASSPTAPEDMEAAIARLRKKTDKARPTSSGLESTTSRDEIEAAVSKLRQQRVAAATGNGQSTSTSGGVTTATASAKKRAGFCSQCGEARESDDKFCAHCGHAFI